MKIIPLRAIKLEMELPEEVALSDAVETIRGLADENLPDGIGLVFLGSVVIRRPVIYYLARAGIARSSPAEAAEFEALRDQPYFRRAMTVMTLTWGVGLLLSTAVACVLVFSVSIHDYLIVQPVVGYGTMGLLVLWTLAYRRTLQKRVDRPLYDNGRPD